VGEGNNLKPKAIRILESYIKSIFTLVQIQYAEQPEGRVVRIPPPLQILKCSLKKKYTINKIS
jgi:hypothetical protein